LDLETSIHKKYILEVTFFSKLQNGGIVQDGAMFYTFRSCRAISQPITTYILDLQKIIQFKMESIFKMVILHLSIRLSEPVFLPFSNP
jgi:hypothetical protein